MKKLIITLFCALLALLVCAQNSNHDKDYYLTKSKHQKTAFFVLAGTGAVLIVASAASSSSHDNSGEQLKKVGDGFIGVAGAVLIITSVPFLVSSFKNKHRAMSLSVKAEKIPRLNNGNYIYTAVPALSIAIKL